MAFDQPLRPLPFAAWEATKTTLHLFAQIVGKIRLAYTAHRNHWWNVTLLPTATGLNTGRMRDGDTRFEIAFDFVDHHVRVTSNRRAPSTVELHDGLSVAAFYRAIIAALAEHDVHPRLVAKPYGVPMTTPFAQDTEHHHYDRAAVRTWFDMLAWSANVFDAYAADFVGKQSPAHLFWHSFDLAVARYSGRPSSAAPSPDRVAREAYSHEVIACGFWAGDAQTPNPTYYSYTAPEPPTLTAEPLVSDAAWVVSGPGHIAALDYDLVRAAGDPRAKLLDFMQAAYRAGARAAGWETSALASHFGA